MHNLFTHILKSPILRCYTTNTTGHSPCCAHYKDVIYWAYYYSIAYLLWLLCCYHSATECREFTDRGSYFVQHCKYSVHAYYDIQDVSEQRAHSLGDVCSCTQEHTRLL